MITHQNKVALSAQSSPSAESNHWVVFACMDHYADGLPTELHAAVQNAYDKEFFNGKKGEVLPVVHENKVVVLVGMGERESIPSMRSWGEAINSALALPLLSTDTPITVLPPEDTEEVIRGIVDGCMLGLYQWDKYKSDPPTPVRTIHLLSAQAMLIETLVTVALGVNLARDCANENADVATGETLAETIVALVDDHPACTVSIMGQKELEEHGLHLHLAVNQGSTKEPRLVIVKYCAADNAPYDALIGKGITFDTGGLNLKPTGGIESMRMDMSGSAAIIGTLHNVLHLNPKRNLLFVCGFAENAIGPDAYKPGDVIPSYAGLSVEILNTDAEGRLVLADACAYVAKNYKPQSVITIATLTGAVVMALGYEHSGLMASDDDLAESLLASARKSDDWAWRLPMYPQLSQHVKSRIADIKNMGIARCAGTISAGEFLRQFAQHDNPDQNWAHLDIAGTAKPKESVAYFSSGATGAGVRLLTGFSLSE